MSACSEKSFCLSRTHWKPISKVHSFPNNILTQVHCKMDHSVLPTKKTNCHWKADFPRLGCAVDAWGRRVGFFWDSDGSFGSLFALWLMKTLILSSEIIVLWPSVSTEFWDCTMWMLMKAKWKKAVGEEQERREDISRWGLKWDHELTRWRHVGWLFQMAETAEDVTECLSLGTEKYIKGKKHQIVKALPTAQNTVLKSENAKRIQILF